MSDTTTDVCASIGWDYETDSSLGGSTQEWEEAADPDDLDTALEANECVIDASSGTIIRDAVTGCIKGAEAGIAVGAAPLYYITKRVRIRHLTEEQKRRLRKKLNID